MSVASFVFRKNVAVSEWRRGREGRVRFPSRPGVFFFSSTSGEQNARGTCGTRNVVRGTSGGRCCDTIGPRAVRRARPTAISRNCSQCGFPGVNETDFGRCTCTRNNARVTIISYANGAVTRAFCFSDVGVWPARRRRVMTMMSCDVEPWHNARTGGRRLRVTRSRYGGEDAVVRGASMRASLKARFPSGMQRRKSRS